MHRNLRLYASKKMSLPQQCHNVAFYPFLDTSTGNKFELCSSFKYLCVRFLNHKPINKEWHWVISLSSMRTKQRIERGGDGQKARTDKALLPLEVVF